jgi:hypothetical protein
MKQTEIRQQLSERIGEQQDAVLAFLQKERPRRNRLINLSVWGSVLAAILTVGPAVGGTRFTTALQGIFSLRESSLVWQVLCLIAVILSAGAALATNLASSHSVAAKVTAAEVCNAQLDALRLALDLGQIDPGEAGKLLQQHVAQVSFISRRTAGAHTSTSGVYHRPAA